MQMNNQFELIAKTIRERRAIFPAQFNDEPIAIDLVDQLLELANWAPTHKRTEPWRFVVISGKAKDRLGDFLAETYKASSNNFIERKYSKIRKNCARSQHIILLNMQCSQEVRIPEWEEVAATAMSIQNIWLACQSLGIGGYWSSPGLIAHMGKFIPLAEGEKCMGLFYLGRYDMENHPEGSRTPVVDKVRYIAL